MMYQDTTIIGYLGKDPELRFAPSGEPVASFSVATNRVWTDNGEKKKETTWFRVTVWGKRGESCNQYLKKGSKVMVRGRLSPDPKTGRPRTFKYADGTMGTNYDLVALDVRFLDSAEDNRQTEAEPGELAEDEIPF
jgi:single-strand DNA-binding protein